MEIYGLKTLKELCYLGNTPSVLLPGHVLGSRPVLPLNVLGQAGKNCGNNSLGERAEHVSGRLCWSSDHRNTSVVQSGIPCMSGSADTPDHYSTANRPGIEKVHHVAIKHRWQERIEPR